MRAKTVNEDQHFERGKNPKAALGIGGIDLYKSHTEILDDLKNEISILKSHYDEEWEEYLRKLLVGKTITAKMKNLPSFNTKTKSSIPSKGSGEFTITVQDVKPGEPISDSLDRGLNPLYHIIILADTDNNIYSMSLEEWEKINIE